MLRFTCLVLLVTVAVGLEFQVQLNNQWQKFKSAHGKKYTGDEEVKRQTNFKKNVQAILEHNLQHDLGEKSYTLGVNEFSDMDHDEFVKTMCGLRLPANFSTSGREVFDARPDAPTAATIDWRKQGVVTPVKNQGHCGACWSYGTIGTVEGAYAIKYHTLKTLSEQHLVDCASNSYYPNRGCGGGAPYLAMEYILDNGGINEDRCYRYVEKQQSCRQVKSCNTARLAKYVDVRYNDEKALLQAVNIGPVTVGINADDYDFSHYRVGVYTPTYCSQDTNHAVLIVGYGNEEGKDYWLVKNSYGLSWGDQGYIKMIRGRNVCGITSMPSFAVVA